MPDTPYLSRAQHGPRQLPSRLKPQFVVDQRENIFPGSSLGHFLSFGNVHRHRLFAENVIIMLEREKHDLAMEYRRCGDAYKIDAVARNGLTPITRKMPDAE